MERLIPIKKEVISYPVTTVLCSPLLRARQTAEFLFADRTIPILITDTLIERGLGKIDGLQREEAAKDFPSALDFYHGRIQELEAAGIEPIPVLLERCLRALQEITTAYTHETVAIVSHFFWIKTALSLLLSKPYDEVQKDFRTPSPSITVLDGTTEHDFCFHLIEQLGLLPDRT